VIKLAPVIKALQETAANQGEISFRQKEAKGECGKQEKLRPVLCFTGQHREMVEPFLKFFRLKPDYDLKVMKENQDLSGLTSRLITRLNKVLKAEKPDWLLVQGDTTSAMVAALVAFYQKIKIGHVEAGLRTDDKYNPFPEEINRRLISHLTDLHFAPTERARENLLKEGIEGTRIFVTGNTVVDALKLILKRTEGKEWFKNLKLIEEDRIRQKENLTGVGRKEKKIAEEKVAESESQRRFYSGHSSERIGPETRGDEKIQKLKELKAAIFRNKVKEGGRSGKNGRSVGVGRTGRNNRRKKLILVTAHRRESFGKGMEEICRAILQIVEKVAEAEVVFPVHLNPNVRKVVRRYLAGRDRIYLLEPVDYFTFVQLMKRSSLILTDSGGIQEEAPSLGVPVVVMREVTERPEAVEAGVAWISGTRAENIVHLALKLLQEVEKTEERKFRSGLRRKNPFGDGRASWRIVRALKK